METKLSVIYCLNKFTAYLNSCCKKIANGLSKPFLEKSITLRGICAFHFGRNYCKTAVD
jgi:hypothetical protein